VIKGISKKLTPAVAGIKRCGFSELLKFYLLTKFIVGRKSEGFEVILVKSESCNNKPVLNLLQTNKIIVRFVK